MSIPQHRTADAEVIAEQPSELTFPACHPDHEVQRANARRYLYGDVPAHRRSHLTVRIDENMRRLNVAVISKQLLDEVIDQIETTRATLISERDELDRISREASRADI